MQGFELNMAGVRFLNVGQICLLAMYGKWAIGRFGKGRISGLDACQQVKQYLQRIDFFRYFKLDIPESFNRHSSNDFVEIREIVNDEDNTANDIPAKFRRVLETNSHLDRSVISAVDNSFGEIMDNVLTHSYTETPGIAVAQYYPLKNYIEFCVADAGIGIPRSLKRNPQFRNIPDCDLLKQSFEFGVGENVYGANGCDEGHGCGYGLAFASKFAQASNGKLWAISHRDAIQIGQSGIRVVEGCWFPGTVVCMRVPSNIALSESDLDVDGRARPNRPYYWDDKGNELEDIFENGILW